MIERVENIGCHQEVPAEPEATKPTTWRPLFGQCGRCERRLLSVHVPAAIHTLWLCESCDGWMIKRREAI